MEEEESFPGAGGENRNGNVRAPVDNCRRTITKCERCGTVMNDEFEQCGLDDDECPGVGIETVYDMCYDCEMDIDR